jgi:uncharacterized lipoprotein YajG
MKMMWRRRIKMLSIIVVIAVAVMLIGCTAKPKPTLKALDSFWDTLGGKTTDLASKAK